MNAPMLRTLSGVAAIAALVGVVLLVYRLATGSGSLAGASALTLIAIVLFFTFRHMMNKDGS